MNCKIKTKTEPCYLISNMKEVRANFLLMTGQEGRLQELTEKLNEMGLNVFYYKSEQSKEGRMIIEKPETTYLDRI